MRDRGQAIAEFALILPVFLFTCLGFIEAGFLVATQATQAHATSVVADYAAAHHGDSSWNAVAVQVGLGGCAVTVEDEAHDIVHVVSTCQYDPRVTHGLWDGIPLSTEADAAVDATPAPSVDPSASPS